MTQESDTMSWFWNAFGAKTNAAEKKRHSRRNTPTMTSQTSFKIQQFETGTRRTGSLVFSKEDLKAVNLQTKIDQARRKIDRNRLDYDDEVQILRNVKDVLLLQLDQKLATMNDTVVYQEIIQNIFLQEGLAMADPGDGTKEAEILKEIHKSELKDKVRTNFQIQASDELMEVCRTSPKFKERMGEREAKLLSFVFQKDALLTQRKELLEKILKIQKAMIVELEKANKEQFQKRYEAIRDGNSTEDGDLVTRKQNRDTKEATSYSARVLGGASSREKTETTGGMKDVILEEDLPNESHIGEVKNRPAKPTNAREATRPATRSRSPVAPSNRGGLSTRRGETSTTTRATASTTTRVRARPAPPSSRAAADRSPTRQTTTTSWQRNSGPSSSTPATSRRPVSNATTGTRPASSATASSRLAASRTATRPTAARSPTRRTPTTTRSDSGATGSSGNA